MKKLLIVFLFCCLGLFAGAQTYCNHVPPIDSLNQLALVIAHDFSGRFVAKKMLNYKDGFNVQYELCLPNGIYIITIPEKKKVFKLGVR